MRVYAIAALVGRPTREVTAWLREHGVPVVSPSSVIREPVLVETIVAALSP